VPFSATPAFSLAPLASEIENTASDTSCLTGNHY
jgi:hypothetical protein